MKNLTLICGILVLFTGCGGGGEGSGRQVPVFPVSGKITMGGAPVANAIVSFSPQKNQPAATGKTNSNGEYQLTTYEGYDGAAEGDYIVLVTKSAGAGAQGPSEEEMHEAMSGGAPPAHNASEGGTDEEDEGSLLPDKYGDQNLSDLKATVTANGENVFNFDLSP